MAFKRQSTSRAISPGYSACTAMSSGQGRFPACTRACRRNALFGESVLRPAGMHIRYSWRGIDDGKKHFFFLFSFILLTFATLPNNSLACICSSFSVSPRFLPFLIYIPYFLLRVRTTVLGGETVTIVLSLLGATAPLFA